MNEQELVKFVKSLHKSLMYCAPEAVEELLFDKLHPHMCGPARRIAELEAQLAAVLATIEEAAADDGRDYAEGCKP